MRQPTLQRLAAVIARNGEMSVRFADVRLDLCRFLREWRLRNWREGAVERLSDPIAAAAFDSERERGEQNHATDVGFDVLQTLGLTLEESVDVTASLLY